VVEWATPQWLFYKQDSTVTRFSQRLLGLAVALPVVVAQPLSVSSNPYAF